jgi:hypothetical protein
MSSPAPANWDVPSPASTTNIGTFITDVTVNSQTSITTVGLPFYDPEKPAKGTRAAREAMLHLLAEAHGGFNPLTFRSEYERDNVTVDPYYKYAPGWSTLGGGRNPQITQSPYAIAKSVADAIPQVPFIQAMRIFVTGACGTKKTATLEELGALDITIKPVPNLRATLTSPGGSGGGGEAAAAAALLADRQKALEAELVAERASTMALHQQMRELTKLVEAFGPPRVFATVTSEPEPIVVDGDAPAPAVGDKRAAASSKAAGKRVRRA